MRRRYVVVEFLWEDARLMGFVKQVSHVPSRTAANIRSAILRPPDYRVAGGAEEELVREVCESVEGVLAVQVEVCCRFGMPVVVLLLYDKGYWIV